MQSQAVFYRNEGKNRFVDVSARAGLKDLSWSGDASTVDVNDDGWPDLYLVNMEGDDQYYENVGGTGFVNKSRQVFPKTSWGAMGIKVLKLNDRGQRFVDAEFVLGIEPRSGGIVTPWFELDASGKDRNHPGVAGATGRVTFWAARGTRSAVIFDVEGDGDLDIVTNEFNASPMVLLSNLNEKTSVHYLGVRLVGTSSNRSGLGTVVKVTAEGSTYTKVMDGNSGYLSHSLYALYFGLGAANKVERVDVLWPSGTKQTLRPPIKMNAVMEVREPQLPSVSK